LRPPTRATQGEPCLLREELGQRPSRFKVTHPSGFKKEVFEKMEEMKAKYTEKSVHKMVEKFGDYVVWLFSVHDIYKVLFEDSQAKKIMVKTAVAFFSDFHRIIIQYIILVFAKISDSAFSNVDGKKCANFSVNNLIETIEWPPTTQKKLDELKQKVKRFRHYIIKTRNKFLAHNDKETFLNNKGTLGEFPLGEDVKFLKVLEEICDITYRECFNVPLGSISVGLPGDADDLKKALMEAVAFRELSESGNKKIQSILFSALDKVDEEIQKE
jgi:hypothetical protein